MWSINMHCKALDSVMPGNSSPKFLGIRECSEKTTVVGGVRKSVEDVFSVLPEDMGIKILEKQCIIKENKCKVAFLK